MGIFSKVGKKFYVAQAGSTLLDHGLIPFVKIESKFLAKIQCYSIPTSLKWSVMHRISAWKIWGKFTTI